MFFPAYHIDNFKAWTPSHTKSLNSSSPEPSISSFLKSHKPPTNSLSSNPLPVPGTQAPIHPLPARPPAEVCVHSTTNTRSDIRVTSLPQPQATSEPPSNTPHTENFKHGTTPPHDPAHHTPDSDLNPPCDFQDITDAPIELPSFRDVAGDSPSSPSTSGSDESLEEFFKLSGVQNNIPIDPIILGEDGSWDAIHHVVPQGDSEGISEKFCPYPEPPSIPRNAPDYHDGSNEQCGSQDDNTQPNSSLQGHGRQQFHPSQRSTEPDTPYTNIPEENFQSGNQSRNCKRKTRRPEGQTRKRRRAPTSLAKEYSFDALCADFTSLPLDERLQFLSWLFEGALSRCLPDSMSTTCEDGNKHSASHSTVSQEIERSRRNGSKVYRGSRKRKLWSKEEEDLLRKLRKDEGRPWSEVMRLFSDQYPGRSQGSIQVYWSTTLKNKG